MKKFLVSTAAFMMAAAVSTTAFAGTYDPEKNEVSVDGTGYKTVIITEKNNISKIVYVNQAKSDFGASAEFMLKSEPTAGFYTIMLGGSGDIESQDIYIGSADKIGEYAAGANGAAELTLKFDAVKEEDETYTLAFATENAVSLDSIKAIIVKVGDTYLVKETETTVTGGGEALVGIQITGVSETQKNAGLSVYLTPVALKGGND